MKKTAVFIVVAILLCFSTLTVFAAGTKYYSITNPPTIPPTQVPTNVAVVNGQVINVGQTFTYTVTLKTPGKVGDIIGEIDFPSDLVTYEGYSIPNLPEGVSVEVQDGKIIFRATSTGGYANFVGSEATLIQVKFYVKNSGNANITSNISDCKGVDGTTYISNNNVVAAGVSFNGVVASSSSGNGSSTSPVTGDSNSNAPIMFSLLAIIVLSGVAFSARRYFVK
ncbi:MAG: hypothetical protein Q8876_04895 [Bacillota bacterium]|nr:hypothetical protein [Bacillota bacterium]